MKWTRLLLGRWLPAIMLIVAGVSKLAAPVAVGAALEWLGVPPSLTTISAVALAVIELLLGLALLLVRGRNWPVALGAGLLLAFTGVLFTMVLSKSPPSCGCIGLLRFFETNRKELIFGIARNMFLVTGMLWLLADQSRREAVAPAYSPI